MIDFIGADYIYNGLKNNISITTIVGTSIYNDTVIPVADISTETINFYDISPLFGGQEYFDKRYSIDCRAASSAVSKNIAELVFLEFNRNSGDASGKKYFSRCDIGQTIPPADSQDVYNTPVTIYLRRK